MKNEMYNEKHTIARLPVENKTMQERNKPSILRSWTWKKNSSPP